VKGSAAWIEPTSRFYGRQVRPASQCASR